MSNPYYLQMVGINKTFPGVKALDSVSIDVSPGEIVALLGENGAGKSTLMHVLGGIYRCDTGHIVIDGKQVQLDSVADAIKVGIAFIHQELSLLKNLSVEENLFIDCLPEFGKTKIINRKQLSLQAEKAIKMVGLDIPLKTAAGVLTIGQRQLVEIAGALAKNANIIILDEPTTSLSAHESSMLYGLVRGLKSAGKCILYISHDLDAALKLSDRFYVLRDGKNSGSGISSETTKDQLVDMMIGRSTGKIFSKSFRDRVGEVAMDVEDLCMEGTLHNISFKAREGEILGLYGLVGSGRTELMQCIYGLNKCTYGSLKVKGEPIKKPNPRQMKELGVGYLTEDRRSEGLFLELDIKHNICITDLKKISKRRMGVIDEKQEESLSNEMIGALRVSAPSIDQLAGKLSGGNQQKVVISKWLHLQPGIFILDEPTRGIDIGAKTEIYKIIDDLANKGLCVILISSEIEEIIGICDKVLVMSKGRIVEELVGVDINETKIIGAALGVGHA